jgi:RNA polymerase sigma-70 factor, ECF subfamily
MLQDSVNVVERRMSEMKAESPIRALLESVLDTLPEDYRIVLMLRDVEGLSASETAECLNLERRSLEARLFRARATLRKQLFASVVQAAPDAFPFQGARCDRVVETVLRRIRR